MRSEWNNAEFETIFRGHYARILQVIRRVLQADAQAEEICSEVFLRLYCAGPEVASSGQVGGWLYRSATRAAIDALRANRRGGLQPGHEELVDPADESDSALTRLLRNERIRDVREVLSRLKVEKAQILLLRYGGFSYQEIAVTMQIRPGSVGTMLARAEAEFCRLYQRRQRQRGSATTLQPALGRGTEVELNAAKERS